MDIRRDRALALLSQCRGDEIWSVEYCIERGVPKHWIDKLSDAYESGYQNDTQTIYADNRMTNQYHGVRDSDLAIELAKSLGIAVSELGFETLGQKSIVKAIKQAVMEG
ncbi:hypothetical protein OAE79_01835 [Rhodopirellula sp.]|nr:hypothetical protein [Rhodopirellula sp.]MDB4679056.1 hypothetical protein [Rhodopirellula sp.]